MSDRIDPSGFGRPTPSQEADALRVLAGLAEVGGVIFNRRSGWSAVPLMAGTEETERRTIVAGMSYVEAYRGEGRDAGLRVWRGRVAGWPLAVSVFDIAETGTGISPTDPPAAPARMGLARVLAVVPPPRGQLVDLAAVRAARAAIDHAAETYVDQALQHVWSDAPAQTQPNTETDR